MNDFVQKIRVRTPEILSPYAAPSAKPVPLARRLDTLRGKRIVLWDDHVAPSRQVLDEVEQFMQAQGVASVVRADQPGPSYPPQDYNIAKVKESDAVVLGVAA